MKIQDQLQACLADPMWADHAEVSKVTLRVAVDTIRVLERDAARFNMMLRLAAEDEGNYTDEDGPLTKAAHEIAEALDAQFPDAKAGDQMARMLDRLIERFPETK